VPLPEHPTDWQRNTCGLEDSLFVTANCFYRKDVLRAAGGFDESFSAAWREDSDLFFTLHERGCLLAQAPEAIVYHPARPEPWGASLRHQRKSIFNALLYKKHPALYRQHIQSSPPWRYYATLAALLGFLAGLLARVPLLALPAGLAWLALYLAFALQRLKNTSRAPAHVLEMLLTSLIIPYLSIFWRLRGAWKYRVWFY
jgi:GT2 family glycosyltransferase